MPRFLLLIALSALAAPALAQQPDEAGWIRVQSNDSTAVLLRAGEPLGVVGDGPLAAPSGAADFALVEGRPDVWEPRRTEAALTVPAGDTLEVRLALPLRYRVETLPVGAEVVLETDAGAEVLGTTPLDVLRDGPLEGTLVTRKPGFLPARVAPGEALTNRHTLLLRPLEDRAVAESAAGWTPPRRSTAWMDYAAAGLALASAGVAIYYKFEADDVDDRYREPGSPQRGNPALKAEAEHLDGYALAALATMQVSLGFLAVRFVLR